MFVKHLQTTIQLILLDYPINPQILQIIKIHLFG